MNQTQYSVSGKTGRSLQGRIIVVTRASSQAASLSELLRAEGAQVLELPLIEISYVHDPALAEEIFAELGSYDWLIFTSANGVKGFFRLFFQKFHDIRSLGFLRIAVVGPGTAKALREYWLQPELVPDKEQTAEGLAEALVATDSIENGRQLVITGNRNRDVLVQTLEKAGGIVDRLPVYATEELDLAHCPASASFRQSGADGIIFTSTSGVRGFTRQAKYLVCDEGAKTPVAFSIGGQTSAALKEAGVNVASEADTPTPEGLLACLQQYRWP